MLIPTFGYSRVSLCRLSLNLRIGYIFLILCRWPILEYILDIVNVMLWRLWIPLYSSEVLIFIFNYFSFHRYLYWLAKTTVCFLCWWGLNSAFTFSLASWSLFHIFQQSAKIWVEFIQRLSFFLCVPRISSHFPTAVVALSLIFWFFTPQRQVV